MRKANRNVYLQLLAQLAPDRVEHRLAVEDLTAWELPEAAVALVTGTQAEEDGIVASNHGSSDADWVEA